MALLKNIRNLILASLLSPAMAVGEDIDLYQGGAEITGNKPNVLIILDNSANWAAANQGWPGGIKQGESELNALIQALAVQTGDIRVGLMMFTDAGPNGGYVRFGIRDMVVNNRTSLQSIMAGIKPNFNTPTEKVASAKTNYSNVMYEAYRYFGGKTRYAAHDAKRDYTGNGSYNVSPYTAGNVSGNAFSSAGSDQYLTPLSTDFPCSKNFIIFIGNGYPSQDTDPATLGDPVVSANMNRNQVYASNAVNYADEWARFLKDYGTETVCTGTAPNQVCANSKILTYTIDVYKDQQDLDQTRLLKSMAAVGGGTYCHGNSEDAIRNCLNNIFNETQAVDSVFTSASLPVSVNTQGTYLNQIYMGVFRPDNGGRPRWLGNLKEYRFGLTTDASGNDTIYLADSTDTNGIATPAVNSITGFIKPGAVSYWSSSSTPAPGFWAFSPKGNGGQYDAPDGDLVEKGAVAQKLRTLGHAARTIYTCPAGGCTTNTTPNLFNTSNAALVSALTFPSTSVSLTRSGPSVQGTLSSDLSLASPTDTLTISGSNVPAYNATWSVTKLTPTTFSFTIEETPATPATGVTMTAAAGSAVSQSIPAGGVTYGSTAGSANYGKALVNLPGHGFINNQTVTIAGATPGNYNGTFTVNIIDANNFTYTPTLTTQESPEAVNAAGSIGTVKCGPTGSEETYTLSALRRAANSTGTNGATSGNSIVVAVTSAASTNGTRKCKVDSQVVISGFTGVAGYNGTYTISSTSCPTLYGVANTANQTFCFQIAMGSVTINPASPATGTITAAGVPTRAVTSITRTPGNASNVATVTVTTAVPHGFSGSSVVINGADQAEYNGTKTVSSNGLAFPTSTTITYTLTTGPAASATGGSAARGSAVDPTTLINWVRGMDNKEDENANGSLTDVRASIHGDVLHSRPVVINYGDTTGLVAYYGSNDGMLRAVKAGQAGTDGVEKWSFVAPEHYTTLARLYNNSPVIKFPTTSAGITPTPTKRDYFFDGNIGVYQSPTLDTTHLFVTMRRGGRVVYAFDVSNPDAPKFMWKKSYGSGGDFSEMGYTWSEPKVILLKKTSGVACSVSDSSTYTRALVFGAGYDPTEEDKENQGTVGVVRNPGMGRGVFVLNAADGNLIKLMQPADTKKYSFSAEVTLLDTDADGCVDRVYAVDTGANIHRFDIGDADASNWKTYKIAQLGDVEDNGGPNDRKFLYPADTVLGYIGGVQTAFLLVGSGNREVPRDETVENMFFMVKDVISAGTDPTTVTPARIGNLTEVTDFNSTTTTLDATASTFKGWYITLEPGEKVVNSPLTVAGTTFFGTNKPRSASNQCTPNLGIARGYAVSYLDGTSAAGDRDANGTVSRNDLYANFTGGGLPPSPVGGIVKIGDKFVRFVIGGGGSAVEGSTIQGAKVQANPNSTRTRAYWYFKKDD